MSESWLEITDPDLDADQIQRRIEERMAQRETTGVRAVCEDVGQDPDAGQAVDAPDAGRLCEEASKDRISRWLRDSDILPANYTIDWRVPIIGPIHAAVRRVICAEIRRFLHPALVKQSHLNRAVLEALSELFQENARMRQELEQLRQAQDQDR